MHTVQLLSKPGSAHSITPPVYTWRSTQYSSTCLHLAVHTVQLLSKPGSAHSITPPVYTWRSTQYSSTCLHLAVHTVQLLSKPGSAHSIAPPVYTWQCTQYISTCLHQAVHTVQLHLSTPGSAHSTAPPVYTVAVHTTVQLHLPYYTLKKKLAIQEASSPQYCTSSSNVWAKETAFAETELYKMYIICAEYLCP